MIFVSRMSTCNVPRNWLRAVSKWRSVTTAPGRSASVLQETISEEVRLLGCYTVWLLYERTFQTNVSPPSLG
jgi:hypothetical protein